MILFSLSNGYLSNICMMSAPQIVKGSEGQTAASLMVALLGLGLGTGALLSYPVKMLIWRSQEIVIICMYTFFKKPLDWNY